MGLKPNRDIRHLPPSPLADFWKDQVTQIKKALPVLEVQMPGEYPTDVPILWVEAGQIVSLLSSLKTQFKYDFFSDMTATDEESDPRFIVVYQLFSHETKSRIRVKTRVAEGQEVPTAISVWPAVEWAEREIWDMFGIRFSGHPDLRRILMDERFQGHPLRKDYPLRGYQIFTEPESVHRELLE